MAIWLQIILALVLVAVGACLVPLLLQARRTAAAVEHLAESAREDLRQVAGDVHHVRERVDGLADMAAASLETPLAIGRIFTGTAQAVQNLLAKSGPPWMDALISGLRFVIHLVRRSRQASADPGK